MSKSSWKSPGRRAIHTKTCLPNLHKSCDAWLFAVAMVEEGFILQFHGSKEIPSLSPENNRNLKSQESPFPLPRLPDTHEFTGQNQATCFHTVIKVFWKHFQALSQEGLMLTKSWDEVRHLPHLRSHGSCPSYLVVTNTIPAGCLLRLCFEILNAELGTKK